VPLVLRWPGTLPTGRHVDAHAGLVDLMPTLLALLDVPAPAGMQGRSVAPLVQNGSTAPTAAVVSEHFEPGATQRFESLRQDGFAYIVQGPAEQLYDTRADPGERVNLVAARPDAAAPLRGELERWRDACVPLAVAFGAIGQGPAPDADTVRQLRALGYIQ
jgi:arylsulfatase A-like enzyme